ncbi:MAG: UDP-3-O-(3-hydroxymyristoyl)glucosamine N-acyltransferase [Bacteroidia bacterium]|nr:NeuD/PglB/VioB family sugar acetyltransferase [Zoogloeaceae bacterium]MCG3168349.1 UDP-3-O-(3-hydroxymyristoyl)glucosamine N-acyltransferase [Bacteroidia bacterium]MCK6383194.1 NeuD/PglB/VioB family sugar acetyltransferase [Rhodocyclaceae bacterium]
MSRRKTVVLGSGALARMVGGILKADSAVELVGFTDANPARHGQALCDLPILGSDDMLPGLRRQGVSHAVIAAGDPRLRKRLAALLRELDIELANAVHPHAFVAPEVRLGRGIIVLPGAVLADNPAIGDNTFIGQAATIAHDSTIGCHCLIGGRSAIGGEVSVGDTALVGWGAIIGPRHSVGTGAVIASGANVMSDIPENAVAAGSPARVVQMREAS